MSAGGVATCIVDAGAAVLRRLGRHPGVRGALLATADGRALCWDLNGPSPAAVAAVVASTVALGERLGELAGSAPLEQLVVRTGAGSVVLRTVADGIVLAVVTTAVANLARLDLALRDEMISFRVNAPSDTSSDSPNDIASKHERSEPC